MDELVIGSPGADRVYEHGRRQVEELLRAAAQDVPLDIAGVLKATRMLLKNLREGDRLLFKAIHSHHPEDFLATHCLNVGILAMKVGLSQNYPERDLLVLGLAALVHDLGMAKVPQEIVKKVDSLTSEEMEAIRKHPLYGRDLLSSIEKPFPWLSTVVYQEHEREDGSGYPLGLRGEEIHPHAKIIGVVDVYEALTHPRVHRDGLIAYQAIKTLMEMRGATFSPQTLKALIEAISIFPLDSLVRLNTGEIGRVIQVNRLYPLRPRVEIVYGAKGEKLPGPRVVNLEEEPFLYIAGPVLELRAEASNSNSSGGIISQRETGLQ